MSKFILGFLILTQICFAAPEYKGVNFHMGSPWWSFEIPLQEERDESEKWHYILPSNIEVIQNSERDTKYSYNISALGNHVAIEHLEQLHFRDMHINTETIKATEDEIQMTAVYSIKVFRNTLVQATINVEAKLKLDSQTLELVEMTNNYYSLSGLDEVTGRALHIINHYNGEMVEDISNAIVLPFLLENPEYLQEALSTSNLKTPVLH